MTTEDNHSEAAQPTAPAEPLDANSEIERFRLNLESVIRLHAHLPLAAVVGQLIVTANDIQTNTRAMQNREAMRRHQAALEAKAAATAPDMAKKGPTGIVRTGGKGRNHKRR